MQTGAVSKNKLEPGLGGESMTFIIVFLTAIVVWLSRGIYDPSVPVLVAFFLYWTAETIFGKDRLRFANSYSFLLPWIFAICFIFQNDLLYVSASQKALIPFLKLLPFLGLVCFELNRKNANRFWIYLGSLLLSLGFLAVPFLSPEPHIDVFQSNRMAVDFFLHGTNPYASLYTDIYHQQYDYLPGFLYWPGALLLQTVSQILFHDIRVILILAWLAAGLLLKEKKTILLIWLTLPFLAFAFEQAWLDPLIALGGALTLYGLRKQKLMLWVFGVVIAATVKQYGFMIGLFSMIYFVRLNGISRTIKPFLMMAIGFLVILAPFVAWNPHAFLDMTVLTHAHAKIRPDALNFTAFWLKNTGLELSSLTQLFFILFGLCAACMHVLKNFTRGLRVIPEAWAVFFGFSIYFGKFAFCNYFLLLICFWLMAESEGAVPDLIEQKNLRVNT
jgi:hypothetical protein